jgi:hypothetical protein
MQQVQTKRYQPPAAQWLRIIRDGKFLFRFDPLRGVIEFDHRSVSYTIDLAQEMERWERQAREAEAQIVS